MPDLDQSFTRILVKLSLSNKPPAVSKQLCCTTGDWRPQKEPHESDSLLASLASHTTQVTAQDPILHL